MGRARAVERKEGRFLAYILVRRVLGGVGWFNGVVSGTRVDDVFCWIGVAVAGFCGGLGRANTHGGFFNVLTVPNGMLL